MDIVFIEKKNIQVDEEEVVMEITAFDIYLIGIVDPLIVSLQVTGVLSLIMGFIAFVYAMLDQEAQEHVWTKKLLLVVPFLLLMLSGFVPNSRTLAAMYLVPRIANNESVVNITQNSLSILEQKMMEWLKEISRDGEE
jgi:uncharacterized membrane protein HdeD (DUF308 family)